MCRIVLCYSRLVNSATQHVTTLLTACCLSSCDVPRWATTHVPRVVSTAWCSPHMYSGNRTTLICAASVVLTRRRARDGSRGVTSRRCDVTDSERISYSVCSHMSYCEWSSADTRQMHLSQSAMYSWRPVWQTTMSRGHLIPSMSMTELSFSYVCMSYRLMVEDSSQTYMMLSRYVIPATSPTTQNTISPLQWSAISYLLHNSVHFKICLFHTDIYWLFTAIMMRHSYFIILYNFMFNWWLVNRERRGKPCISLAI